MFTVIFDQGTYKQEILVSLAQEGKPLSRFHHWIQFRHWGSRCPPPLSISLKNKGSLRSKDTCNQEKLMSFKISKIDDLEELCIGHFNTKGKHLVGFDLPKIFKPPSLSKKREKGVQDSFFFICQFFFFFTFFSRYTGPIWMQFLMKLSYDPE